MSCGGCGCCPKCGCRATCTCNRNIWSLESRDGDDMSYVSLKPVEDDYEGQYNFNGDSQYFSSQTCYNLVAGKNKCGICDSAGTYTKEWECNGGCGADCGSAN